MNIKLKKKEKIIVFETIFKNLKNFIKECCLEFNTDGLYIQGIDPTHAVLIQLKIVKEWFDLYDVNENNNFGLHCETLFKIINCLKTQENIELKREENNSEILEISFLGNDDKISKTFELTEIQIENNKIDIPSNIEYESDLIINTGDLSDVVKELTIFNENITFCFNEENLELKTNGTLGNAKILLDNNSIELYQIEEDLNFELTFSGDFLNNVCCFNKLNKNITISSSQQYPLKMEYNLDIYHEKEMKKSDDDDEIITADSFCTFHIASIVE